MFLYFSDQNLCINDQSIIKFVLELDPFNNITDYILIEEMIINIALILDCNSLRKLPNAVQLF